MAAAGQPYELMRFVYGEEALRDEALPSPVALAANPVAEPDLGQALRHRVVFEGGAMGGMTGAQMGGQFRSMRDLAQAGKLWAINGAVPEDVFTAPPLRLCQSRFGSPPEPPSAGPGVFRPETGRHTRRRFPAPARHESP
jgi:hypothetical protein